jgi:hypothetical protein
MRFAGAGFTGGGATDLGGGELDMAGSSLIGWFAQRSRIRACLKASSSLVVISGLNLLEKGSLGHLD